MRVPAGGAGTGVLAAGAASLIIYSIFCHPSVRALRRKLRDFLHHRLVVGGEALHEVVVARLVQLDHSQRLFDWLLYVHTEPLQIWLAPWHAQHFCDYKSSAQFLLKAGAEHEPPSLDIEAVDERALPHPVGPRVGREHLHARRELFEQPALDHFIRLGFLMIEPQHGPAVVEIKALHGVVHAPHR